MDQTQQRANEIETYTSLPTDNPSTISIALRIVEWVEVAIKEHIKLAGQWDLSTDVAASKFDPLVQGRYGLTIDKIIEDGIHFDVFFTFHDHFAKLCDEYRFGKAVLLTVPKNQPLEFDAIKFTTFPTHTNQKPQERDSFIEKLSALQRNAEIGFMPVRASNRLKLDC